MSALVHRCKFVAFGRIVLEVLMILLFFGSTGRTQTTNVTLSGTCNTFANPGQSFVLNGLGQRDSMSCNFGPQNQASGAVWGEPLTVGGTLTNLKVKQSPPMGYAGTPGGGTVVISVFPKTGVAPASTGISCSLAGTGDNYSCSSSSTFGVVAGDRVIATVNPPSGTGVNPVSATIEVVPLLATDQTITGACNTVEEIRDAFGNPLQPIPFVPNGLGQSE